MSGPRVSGYFFLVRRPSPAQADFMQRQNATQFSRSASAHEDALFVYRQETLGTWRWLIDTDAVVLEEDFLAAAARAARV
jgi:hypothetical protein